MVKIAFISSLIYFSLVLNSFSQTKDLQIAQALIGKQIDSIEIILDSMNVEYYKTCIGRRSKTIYIVTGKDNVRRFSLKFNDIYKWIYGREIEIKDICIEVFVRYQNDNIFDLRDFYSYEVPANNEYDKYEKSLGCHSSHLKLSISTIQK